MRYYPLFWVRSNNFGDAVNSLLYSRIGLRAPEWADEDYHGKIVACGSIAHAARPGDIVWGTGCNPELPLKCNETTRVLALRGPLSAEIFYEYGFQDITETYGDPVFLLPKFFRFQKSRIVDFNKAPGIVPHYVDKERILKTMGYVGNFRFIDITQPSQVDFARDITDCKYVLSSALHGIVCAEAYGIPAVWCEFSDNVAGNGFKFRDYYLGTNRIPPEPLDFRDKIDMTKVIEKVREWQPPEVDLELLLETCPFNEAMNEEN